MIVYSILAFLPACIVVGSVVRQSKTVSALSQLGSLVSRTEKDIDGVAQGDQKREQALAESQALIEDKDKLVFTFSAFNIGLTCETCHFRIFSLEHWPRVCERAIKRLFADISLFPGTTGGEGHMPDMNSVQTIACGASQALYSDGRPSTFGSGTSPRSSH